MTKTTIDLPFTPEDVRAGRGAAKDYKAIAKEMRNAIDAMELAMMGTRVVELAESFAGASPDVIVRVPITVANLLQMNKALMRLNHIINSDDYVI